jgi:hypothetical protein
MLFSIMTAKFIPDHLQLKYSVNSKFRKEKIKISSCYKLLMAKKFVLKATILESYFII